MKWLFIASIGFSVGKRLSGVNIFYIGEKFPNFLGSGEEFEEIQFCSCFRDLEGNFSEYKEE